MHVFVPGAKVTQWNTTVSAQEKAKIDQETQKQFLCIITIGSSGGSLGIYTWDRRCK